MNKKSQLHPLSSPAQHLLGRLNPRFASVLAASALAVSLTHCAVVEAPEPTVEETSIQYPYTSRSDATDDYHGTTVADPYRWLEATEHPATQQWVDAQNALTDQFFSQQQAEHGFQPRIKQRLTQLWNFPRQSAPTRYGQRYVYWQNNGLQNQNAIYLLEHLDAVPQRILDGNQLSTDGTTAIADISVSPNADYLAYAVAEQGSDWVEWRVRDMHTGQDLNDVIRGVKFTPLAWLPDASGFYYSRYPDTPAGEPDDNQPVAIYFHRLNSAQRNDRSIYDLSRFSAANPYPHMTSDGRFLLARVEHGFDANAIHVLDINQPGARWQPIINQLDGRYEFIASDANLLFFHTTAEAPNGRVIAVDMNRPEASHWQTLIESDGDAAIRDVAYIGGRFFVHRLEQAQSRVDVYSAHGRHQQQLPIAPMSTVQAITGGAEHLEAFIEVESFTQPASVWHYQIDHAEFTQLDTPQPPARLDKLTTRQVWYTSSDGEPVSMFLVHRKDLQLQGNTPTLLYGYGGFNIALTPRFNPHWIAWVERGGVLAVPNLRGGGEYGRDWHLGGTQANKQQVFDDAIYAARWLIDNQYTQPQRLAISGRSNGGLLVGALMTQAPDLFAAALPDVGVFDMLRYHTSSANARSWQSDFGIATDPDMFAALRAYSPLHNVDKPGCYPATLITTGAADNRVAPWHSYKFAASLQYAQHCDAPILLRTWDAAGHGAGSPIWLQIEQAAEQWAFLYQALGLELKPQALQSQAQSSNLTAIP